MMLGLFSPVLVAPVKNSTLYILLGVMGFPEVAFGWQVALLLLKLPFKDFSLILFTVPLWLGLLSPALLVIKSKAANIAMCLYFIFNVIGLFVMLSFQESLGGLFGEGCYIWAIGLCFVMCSRCYASLKQNTEAINKEQVFINE